MEISDRDLWIALVIGNSRWHWGAFEGDRWLGSWHTQHLTAAQTDALQQSRFALPVWQQLGIETVLPRHPDGGGQELPELWMASVVKAPLTWLANYASIHPIATVQVPLQNTYPTLGVDRALALVGAGDVWGWPVLVIDCGTALTFTAGADQRLIGGAILPGLRSQFRALDTDTDQLPEIAFSPNRWPPRWATNTPEAIASGVLHTQLAGIGDFIQAWEAEWFQGAIVLTGGDSTAIYRAIQRQTPSLAQRVRVDPDLGFWGMRVCRRQHLQQLERL